MKKIALPLLLLSLSLSLAGCGLGTPSASQLSASDDAQLAAESLSGGDEARLSAIVERLSGDFLGTASLEAASSDPFVGPRAGLLYRALDKSQVLRTLGYKLSGAIVKRHFSKPGTVDDVPPIGPADRAALSRALQPGDVIQCGNNSSFVHAIFYLGDDVIVHALAQEGFGRKMIGVREETLTAYLDRAERDKVVVLRPRWTPEKLQDAIAFSRAQVGKDYDTLFMTDADDRFYCTELVYRILTRTGVARVEPHKVKGGWRLVMNEDFRKSPDLAVVYRLNHD
ncbi:MAG TPA: YiiX/YebB-like N1pC/P60 family cysteine hydrolase [Pantanalinema sp.]